jgi:hypothetical protein
MPLGAHLLVERAERNPLAEDLQSHALTDIALSPAVGEENGLFAHHVDEARGDREPAGINLPRRPDRRPRCAAAIGRTNGGDRVATDGDVPDIRLVTRAVVDRAATDQDVVVHGERAFQTTR